LPRKDGLEKEKRNAAKMPIRSFSVDLAADFIYI